GAEIGADGDRVGLERGAREQVRLGVGPHGRADVAALDVEDRQHTGLAGLGQQLLEHPDAGGAVALEERRLRLERRDRTADRGQRTPRELPQPLGGVRQRPRLEQGGVRVDAGDHPAAGLHGPSEALPEALGPAHAPTRTVRARASRAVWSCRLVTSNGSTGRASIAWTAAWNSCSVVIMGTSMLVAAARIA